MTAKASRPSGSGEHWYGCSCRVVWIAVVAWGVRDWAKARRWQG